MRYVPRAARVACALAPRADDARLARRHQYVALRMLNKPIKNTIIYLNYLAKLHTSDMMGINISTRLEQKLYISLFEK